MRLFVGQAGLRGEISRYAKRFEMVEVLADRDRLPRRSKLEGWRSAVPPTFVWSVVLPQPVASLETSPQTETMLTHAELAADALRASWWVVKTPASVTPTLASRRRLAALAERLQRSERRVAWEPRGLWSADDADEVAGSLGVYVARDGTREDLPPTPVVYSRIRALGAGFRTGPAAIERLVEQIRDRDEAFVILEGEGAAHARNLLREELSLNGAQEDTE